MKRPDTVCTMPDDALARAKAAACKVEVALPVCLRPPTIEPLPSLIPEHDDQHIRVETPSAAPRACAANNTGTVHVFTISNQRMGGTTKYQRRIQQKCAHV